MKLKSYLRQAVAGALCLLICAVGLCQSAFAAGTVLAKPPITGFTDKAEYSLSIQYKPHWDSGVQFCLYKVASVNKDLEFTLTDLFKPYFSDSGLDLNKLDENYKWNELAESLKKNILLKESRDGKPYYTKIGKLTTSTTGRQDAVVSSKDGGNYAELTFQGLYPGLYLIVGDSYSWTDPANGQSYTYTPSTYLVCVPNWSKNDSTDKYEWTKDVKADFTGKTSFNPGKQSFLAFKRWIDNDNAANTRPTSIPIVLYCNGKAYATATLTKDNNWTMTWTNLPPGTYWARESSVPAGYRNTSNVDNYMYTEIVNTYSGGGGGSDPTPPPTNTPGQPPSNTSSPPPTVTSSLPPSGPTPRPSTPVPDIPIEDPDVPLGSVTPPPSVPPEEIELDDPDVPLGNLPQTGMLWWPVPLLAVGGLILLLIGIVRRRNGEFYDE